MLNHTIAVYYNVNDELFREYCISGNDISCIKSQFETGDDTDIINSYKVSQALFLAIKGQCNALDGMVWDDDLYSYFLECYND